MRLHWAALTCVGLVRDHNEDAVVVGDGLLTGDMDGTVAGEWDPSDGPLVLAVADGMGGHAAGEVASGAVADGLAAGFTAPVGPAAVVERLEGLNRALYDWMVEEPATAGMGTTVAGVVASAEGVVVFHAGDSRVYLRRSGVWEQVTRDDVVAPGSSMLTNCLGGEARFTEAEVHTSVHTWDGLDGVLVCSDGLCDLVDPASVPLPDGVAAADLAVVLRELALAGGGHDNISVVVADLTLPGG